MHKGCVLSFGVVIGEGQVVPPFTRLTLSDAKEDDGFGSSSDEDDANDEEEDDEDGVGAGKSGSGDGAAAGGGGGEEGGELKEWDVHLVGADGKGREWRTADEDEDEDYDDQYEDGEVKDEAAAALIQRLMSPRGRDIGATEESMASQNRHLAWTVSLSDVSSLKKT